jgi:hypothetical protein
VSTIAGSTSQPSPDAALERALIDLCRATDGAGLPIVLFHGRLPFGSDGEPDLLFTSRLRIQTREFMRIAQEPIAFENLGGPDPNGEAVYWDNLALLARATAAAIRAGK